MTRTAASAAPPANICPRCGATFACGMGIGQEPCWCTELPALLVLQEIGEACYCPACLRQLIAAQSDDSASS